MKMKHIYIEKMKKFEENRENGQNKRGLCESKKSCMFVKNTKMDFLFFYLISNL
jgi:hypothetical protein